jgi:transposase
VAEARRVLEAAKPLLDPGRLVFIDETATMTNMSRRYGRSQVGDRVYDYVPHGHYKRVTLVSALRCDGLAASMAIPGSLNGGLFVAYVEQVLLPVLSPGDIVFLDNLSAHRRAGARALVEAAGCSLVFLPAYSPDQNPIEMAFSKVKAIIRRERRRTVEALVSLVLGIDASFTPEECANYLAACGYIATQNSKPL